MDQKKIISCMKPKHLQGNWDEDDIRRIFVAGAAWWEFHSTGATMWNSDRRLAEDEATKRYPPIKVNKTQTNNQGDKI